MKHDHVPLVLKQAIHAQVENERLDPEALSALRRLVAGRAIPPPLTTG